MAACRSCAKGVDPSRPIPGDTRATEWQGIHPISDLVQIENPPCGWMQNCNCSPAAMMNRDQPMRDQYARHPHIYNDPLGRCASAGRDGHRLARRQRECECRAGDRHCVQHAGLARRPVARRLKAAWNKAPDADKTADMKEVYSLIAEWDRRSAPDSKGALAFYAFKKGLGGDRARAVTPPTNLSDAQLIQALRQGAEWAKSNFGSVSVPFGEYFRVGRRGSDRSWPVGGGSLQDVGMATPRAISFAPAAGGKRMIGHTGQSSTQVVVLTDPPESYAIIPLGESDHKESGHWDDQAEKLFSQGKALQTYFMRPGELMKHVTSTKVLTPARSR